MDLDQYFQAVHAVAQACLDGGRAPQDLIAAPGIQGRTVAECIQCREDLLAPHEEVELDAYLAIGLFPGQNPKTRKAQYAFCFDIQHALDLLTMMKQCAPYSLEQPLFKGVPDLMNRIRRREDNGGFDNELIDATAVESVHGSEIYKVGRGYAKLSPYLNPGIVNWARKEFPDCPLYIRLDPNEYSAEKPLQYLIEAVLVPANPRWLLDFSLRKNMGDFACYELQDKSWAESFREHWEFHVSGLRRLEVAVQRREHDYLTMMIEELPRPDASNGLMVGRCIHLDTRDPAGTPLHQVRLNHLDLAINVYQEGVRDLRFAQTMQDGKIQDASFRTHLLRIEQASFTSLFVFCEMFLGSRVLLGEWLADLFKSD